LLLEERWVFDILFFLKEKSEREMFFDLDDGEKKKETTL
jgi:hypothetical protein